MSLEMYLQAAAEDTKMQQGGGAGGVAPPPGIPPVHDRVECDICHVHPIRGVHQVIRTTPQFPFELQAYVWLGHL